MKRLEYAQVSSLDKLPPYLDEKHIEQFRFPEPQLSRSPVACANSRLCRVTFDSYSPFVVYADLRKLFKDAKGREHADVLLHASEGGEVIHAHRCTM